jgi:hypothetical protein
LKLLAESTCLIVPVLRDVRRGREGVPDVSLLVCAGKVRMPIQLGAAVTVLALGEVVDDNVNYHNDKYIWTAGYKCKRRYDSTVRLHPLGFKSTFN